MFTDIWYNYNFLKNVLMVIKSEFVAIFLIKSIFN